MLQFLKKRESICCKCKGNLVIWHVSSSQLARLLLPFLYVTPKTPKSWSSSLWEDSAKSYKIGGSISYFRKWLNLAVNIIVVIGYNSHPKKKKKVNMITYLKTLIIELHVFWYSLYTCQISCCLDVIYYLIHKLIFYA